MARRWYPSASALAAACIAVWFSACAHAGDPFTGDVKLMSNYVGRGLSQSVGRPSVAGELRYEPAEGWCAELSGYSINVLDELYPGDSASLLLEVGAAYRHTSTDGTRWQGGVQRVQFPGRYVVQSAPMEEPNTTELVLQATRGGWSAKLDYALTDYYGTLDSRGSWYADLAGAQRLEDAWVLGAHLGHKRLTGADPRSGLGNGRKDYTDYKLSLSYALGSGLSLTLAHTWTNAAAAFYTVQGYNVAGPQTWLLIEKEM